MSDLKWKLDYNQRYGHKENVQPEYDEAVEAWKAALGEINTAIKQVEGRATARLITAEKVISEILKLEQRMDITKKAMEGTSAVLDLNAQDFPNAYKYTPESTQVDLLFKSGSWRIVAIYRGTCHRSGHKWGLKLSDTAKSAILDKASVGFC
ncbi:MAG: hypothetical protein II493_04905 [Spirochaetales bacterium]|nr:hypothetical protein [Spirochaetales bacterium]